MKKLSMYVCVALMAATTILSSCKKDPEPVVEEETPPVIVKPAEKVCYINTLKANGKLSQKYEYNAAGKLSLINTYGDNGTTIEGYTRYNYDANNRVISIETYEGEDKTEYYTFEYNTNNLISKIHYFNKNQVGTLAEFYEIRNTYNAAKENTIADLYTIEDGKPAPYGYIEYTYTNGNLVREVEYAETSGNAMVTRSVDYTYDTKKNPYAAVSVLPAYINGPLVSKNNPTKIVDKDRNGAEESTQTLTYEYTTTNYPSVINSTSTVDPSKTLMVDYTCK
ncbi:MAG: hypothetical protein EOP00_30685 [Pedobacter sp.]|nr:MAG: hypothetical protein EOP00_30685 [Pedobacter sp.]